MKSTLIPLLAALSLSSCATVGDASQSDVSASASPEGTPVALGQSVRVGSLIATPIEVATDSRCPVDATCVWEGELIVVTKLEAEAWTETADMLLGGSMQAAGETVALVAAFPGKHADRAIAPEEYRFVYEAR